MGCGGGRPQVGGERFNIFRGCPGARTATLVLRGGAEQFIDEAERSLHDALQVRIAACNARAAGANRHYRAGPGGYGGLEWGRLQEYPPPGPRRWRQVVRRAMKNASVVPGGGAVDMAVSGSLRDAARAVAGKAQMFISAYAKALEVIPRQLTDNSGFDATDVLNKLRQKHAAPGGAGEQFGVDCNSGGIINTYEAFIWEPAVVKINALTAATEAACLVLSVDETVRNPRSEAPEGGGAARGMMGGRGGGRGGRGGGRGRGMRR